MRLDSQQRVFLFENRIPIDEVFDASSGWPRRVYSIVMRTHGHQVAVGVVPCKNGHRMRTRSGHCAQCNPARLAFQKRYHEAHYIYIAQTGEYIKIGSTYDIDRRALSLDGYGGLSGWIMRDSDYVNDAGQLESIIQSRLEPYRVLEFTVKEDGRLQATYELFRCTYRQAKKAYREVLASKGIWV
jgi:hypothetical protein